jgi:hypothetical protein
VVVGHVGDASIGVAGRGAHFQIPFPEDHPVAMIEPQIRPLDRSAVALRNADSAAGRLLHQPRAGHVIGVAVRIEHGEQHQPEFLHQRPIAEVLLEDRVDDHGLQALRVAHHVGIGRRGSVKQLPENNIVEHG